MPSPAVTLDLLLERLDELEKAYALCSYIDDYQRVQMCRANFQADIDKVKDEIARRSPLNAG